MALRASLLVLVAACFSPDLGSKPFRCGTGNLCPPGYRCDNAGTCVMSGGAADAGARADARAGGDGGAAVCQPNEVVCDGNTARKCRGDGSGFDDTACNVSASELCFPGAGCLALCGGAGGGATEGCEFLPTPVASAESTTGFGIAVLNPGETVARVRIAGGGLGEARFRSVPAHGSIVETLPWIDALAACNAATCNVFGSSSTLAHNVSYQVVATQPVSVVQWNPLGPAVSADASRLLPVRSLGKDYITVGAAPANGWPSFLAVTAWLPGTVTVTPRATTLGTAGFAALPAGVPAMFSMARGDVLLLYSLDDLTGSTVTSDKVVQVVSGAVCASFSEDQVCSHVEEAMLPRPSLFYQALAPLVPGSLYALRVVAADGPTTVQISDGVNVTEHALAGKGSFFDLTVGAGAMPSLLLMSKEQGGLLTAMTLIGSPAMTIYRPLVDKSAIVQALPWMTRVLAVMAKSGDTVMVDGAPLGAANAVVTPIAASGYVTWYVNVAAGPHLVQAPNPIGVSVIGVDLSNGLATFLY